MRDVANQKLAAVLAALDAVSLTTEQRAAITKPLTELHQVALDLDHACCVLKVTPTVTS